MGERRPLRSARAIFLDRDGVLSRNILNPHSGVLEAPLTPDGFQLMPGAIEALAKLADGGFQLILVSNQPNYAKGKASLATLAAIHRKFEAALADASIQFTEFNYCLHHPEGVVPGYSGVCSCRKPSPYFLLRAEERYRLDRRGCWMIGDRLTDVECGRAAGVTTILIAPPNEPERAYRGPAPHHTAADLAEAVGIVMLKANARNSSS